MILYKKVHKFQIELKGQLINIDTYVEVGCLVRNILINSFQLPRSLTYLNLGGVVLPVVQEQVREASGLWGVLAQAGSV